MNNKIKRLGKFFIDAEMSASDVVGIDEDRNWRSFILLNHFLDPFSKGFLGLLDLGVVDSDMWVERLTGGVDSRNDTLFAVRLFIVNLEATMVIIEN